jgi:Myotubularin-like phosphatase domain
MQVPYYLKHTVVQPSPRRHSSLGSTASFENELDLAARSSSNEVEAAVPDVSIEVASDTAATDAEAAAAAAAAAAEEAALTSPASSEARKSSLLRGEVVTNVVQSVLYSCSLTSSPSTAAKLLITNFRLWLQAPAAEPADSNNSLWVPIASVRSVQASATERDVIMIATKDLKGLTIALPQTSSELFVTTLCGVIKRLACPESVAQLFALAHGIQQHTSNNDDDAAAADDSSSSSDYNGWHVYDVHREYARQGLIGRGKKQWRMYDNSTFETVPSYPHTFVVPAATTDR